MCAWAISSQHFKLSSPQGLAIQMFVQEFPGKAFYQKNEPGRSLPDHLNVCAQPPSDFCGGIIWKICLVTFVCFVLGFSFPSSQKSFKSIEYALFIKMKPQARISVKTYFLKLSQFTQP